MRAAYFLIMALLLSVPVLASADPGTAAPKGWKVPRTADGHPDLQGFWSSATLTRLERADRFGNRRTMTVEEATAIEAAQAKLVADGAKASDLSAAEPNCVNFPLGCGYNNFWIDRGTRVATINGEKRTSLLIDPPNGRIPPLTEQRRRELDLRRAARGGSDGPETRTLSDRCLVSFGPSSGPPMLPVLYNSHYQIVQNRDHVMILVEMIHDARIVRLGAQAMPAGVRRWMGDSLGRWEGDTLVVETTHFHEQQTFRGSTSTMKVTERFTLIGPATILYRFTVEDPSAFTRPFTGEVPIHRMPAVIYEYACHEGNYALPGILAAAREVEKNGGVSEPPDDD